MACIHKKTVPVAEATGCWPVADILRHARQAAATRPPRECCGVVAGGKYFPLHNHAERPESGFRIRRASLAGLPVLQAVVHSHVNGPAWPSEKDMRQQQASRLPWLIAVISDDPEKNPESGEVFAFGGVPALMLDQGYRHGVHDCYELIRGWYYQQRGVLLPGFARQWNWWEDGGRLYEEGLLDAGFRQLDAGIAPQRGDVFLASIRSEAVNHAGIWLGDGLILHHLAGSHGHDPCRLPRHEPAERWWKFIRGFARYEQAAPASGMMKA